MKLLHLSFLLALFFAVTEGRTDGRKLKSLQDDWTITGPIASTGITLSGNSLSLTYTVSDAMTDDNIKDPTIWDKGCKAGDNQKEGEAGFVVSVASLSATNGDDRKTSVVTIALTPKLIANDGDLYGTASNGKDGKIDFCFRYMLETESDTEVNFVELLVSINVDLSEDIELDNVTVKPKDQDKATRDKQYAVRAFLCDQSTVAATAANTIPSIKVQGNDDPFKQGSLVTVCVAPDDASIDDGIVMKSINDFTWKRTDDDTIKQSAIVNAKAVANELTSLACNPKDLFCYFSSVLFADFYKTSGSVTGFGSATMEFGSSDVATDSTVTLTVKGISDPNINFEDGSFCTLDVNNLVNIFGHGDWIKPNVDINSPNFSLNQGTVLRVRNERNKREGGLLLWSNGSEAYASWNPISDTKSDDWSIGDVITLLDFPLPSNKKLASIKSYTDIRGIGWNLSADSVRFGQCGVIGHDWGEVLIEYELESENSITGIWTDSSFELPYAIFYYQQDKWVMFRDKCMGNIFDDKQLSEVKATKWRLQWPSTDSFKSEGLSTHGNGGGFHAELLSDVSSVAGRALQEDASVAAIAAASSEFDISIGVSKSDNNNNGVGALRTAAGGASVGTMTTALLSLFGGLIGSAVLFA